MNENAFFLFILFEILEASTFHIINRHSIFKKNRTRNGKEIDMSKLWYRTNDESHFTFVWSIKIWKSGKFHFIIKKSTAKNVMMNLPFFFFFFDYSCGKNCFHSGVVRRKEIEKASCLGWGTWTNFGNSNQNF